MTLTEFLRARIAEDEAAARAVLDNARWGWASVDWNSAEAEEFGQSLGPARVLAECEAKRRIVFEAAPSRSACGTDDWFGGASRIHGDVLRLLALPYARHPDFRQEWRQ